mmetsp:Transcript_8010/g.49488  ORF Transcript_8010/g.49488 Transcript_8010/m.49488 type:complete len:111 (-) Transcript_8010:25-357(-)
MARESAPWCDASSFDATLGLHLGCVVETGGLETTHTWMRTIDVDARCPTLRVHDMNARGRNCQRIPTACKRENDPKTTSTTVARKARTIPQQGYDRFERSSDGGWSNVRT